MIFVCSLVQAINAKIVNFVYLQENPNISAQTIIWHRSKTRLSALQ